MPVVKRSVEQEVSNEELIRDLRAFADEKASAREVFFFDDTGNPTTEAIRVGDILQPKPMFYDNSNVARDTLMLVSLTVPSMGIVACTYLDKNGNVIQSFFNPAVFLGKYEGARNEASSPKTNLRPIEGGRKGRKRG
jgi:hypothetical protein